MCVMLNPNEAASHALWCVPLLWRSAGAVARWGTRWFNILKNKPLYAKSHHTISQTQ